MVDEENINSHNVEKLNINYSCINSNYNIESKTILCIILFRMFTLAFILLSSFFRRHCQIVKDIRFVRNYHDNEMRVFIMWEAI